MITIELEAQKANLARAILNIDDTTIINRIWALLNSSEPIVLQQKKAVKREIGLLDGKAKIEFRDDFVMTTQELLSIK